MYVETLYYVDICDRHIESGNMAECSSCPISLAIMEALPAARRVYTNTKQVEFMLPDYDYRNFALSTSGKNFINRFDTGLSVEPFTLLLKEI